MYGFAIWRDGRLKKVKSGTVRNDLALLSHIFTMARKEWGMEGLRNPVSDIRKPPPGQSRTERIIPNEQKLLMDVARGQFGPLSDVIEFAIETAMRRSEIFNLRFVNINFQDKVTHFGETKNNEPRDVALSKKTISVINRQSKNADVRGSLKRAHRSSGCGLSHLPLVIVTPLVYASSGCQLY